MVEIQMIQISVKLKLYRRADSNKVQWRVTVETSMLLKMDLLNLVSLGKVRLKENINHLESMEPLSKKVLKMDNKWQKKFQLPITKLEF